MGNKHKKILHLISQGNTNQSCNEIAIYYIALLDKLTKSNNTNSEVVVTNGTPNIFDRD